MGHRAGGVAELDLGALLRDLQQEALVTKAVGKHNVEAVVDHIHGGVIALLAFGNAGLDLVLNAQLLAGFLGSVDEVLVVGGLLVVQGDEADLDLGLGVIGGGNSRQGENHDEGQNHCDDLFHSGLSLIIE